MTIEETDPMTVGCLIQWLYFGRFSGFYELNNCRLIPCHPSRSPFDSMSFAERYGWYEKIQTPAMRNCSTNGNPLGAMYEIAERFMLSRLQWHIIRDMVLEGKWHAWVKWF